MSHCLAHRLLCATLLGGLACSPATNSAWQNSRNEYCNQVAEIKKDVGFAEVRAKVDALAAQDGDPEAHARGCGEVRTQLAGISATLIGLESTALVVAAGPKDPAADSVVILSGFFVNTMKTTTEGVFGACRDRHFGIATDMLTRQSDHVDEILTAQVKECKNAGWK